MKIFIFSQKGYERNINEDYAVYKLYESSQCCTFAVVDGMGDLDYGHLVSKLVGDAIINYLDQNLNQINADIPILDALEFADSKLSEFCRGNHCRSGVAVSFGVISNNVLKFTWQGNVRLYYGKPNGWVQLTSDHKLHIGNGVYRLTRCLKGEGLRDDIPIENIAINRNNYLLICTDGLYESSEHIDNLSDIIRTNCIDNSGRFKDDCTGILIELD